MVGDRVENQIDRHPRQVGADAIVRAGAAESDVGIRVAQDVERIGVSVGQSIISNSDSDRKSNSEGLVTGVRSIWISVNSDSDGGELILISVYSELVDMVLRLWC